MTIREHCVIQCRSGMNEPGVGLRIGEGTFIGPHCKIGVGGAVDIGRGVQLGFSVSINAESHESGGTSYTGGHVSRRGVTIGDEAWFGDGVVILDGVHIGARAVAGAGAVVTRSVEPFHDFVRSVDSTAAVLEWVRRGDSSNCRLALASSDAVYGDQGDVDLTEMATRSPVSPYGFHKLAAENLCDSYSRFFGVKVSVVRLFSVYGEGLRKQLFWDALNKFSREESAFFGTVHELRDWIHVEDAAALLCAASNPGQADFEIYNGGNEHADTHHVLSRLALAARQSNLPTFNGLTHTGNPRRLTSNCLHARRQLGWQPRNALEQGLARYVAWFDDERAHLGNHPA